jgi:cyclic-di-GMP phosphodiesterase TipF (flagellum assembly factor)
MTYFIIIAAILAVIMLLNSITIYKMRAELQRQGLRNDQNHTAHQRLVREISQNRYAIALISQQQRNPNADSQNSDDAVSLADELKLIEKEINNSKAPEMLDVMPSNIDSMTDKEILEFIKKAVNENHIAIAQQPIVTLPERQIIYYEIFSRIEVEGQGFIPAQKFISIAKSNDLIGVVDNLLLLRCLKLLKKNLDKQENIEFFINTNAQTFVNTAYLGGLVKFLAANTRLSSKLIFEMSQENWIHLSPDIKTVLESLSLLGCRFSMDQVTILGMDSERLMKQNISFVKLDAQLLTSEMKKSGGFERVKRIKAELENQRINVIIEKVENEKEFLALLDLQIDFGQGYLFGAPYIME